VTHHKKVALCACSLLAFALSAAGASVPRITQPVSLGPLPAEALRLPGDSQVLMGLSMRALVSSDFHWQFSQPGSPLRPTVLDELRLLTDLDSERDIDELVVAMGGSGEVLILVIGRLDRPRLEAVWQRRAPQVPTYALAFLSEHALVLGSKQWVAATSGQIDWPVLRSNAAMLALVRQVPEQAAFWMAGEGGAVSRLSAGSAKNPAKAILPLGLPPLKSLVVAGEIGSSADGAAEPLLIQTLQADAADQQSANNLAAALRGFVALIALQSSGKPATGDLASAVDVTTEQTSVRLTAHLTSDMLAALVARSSAGRRPVQAAP